MEGIRFLIYRVKKKGGGSPAPPLTLTQMKQS